MPSVEKGSAKAVKLENAEAKQPENAKNENSGESNEKSAPAINQVISIISNKVRNLEKRKNKLDGYMKDVDDGKELTSEQEKAVEKYDEVVQQLSLSKELEKKFNTIALAASKDLKREARKSMISRLQQEASKVSKVLIIQDLLQRLRDENVRKDFLKNRNGACRLEMADFEFIDKFAINVMPSRPAFTNELSFEARAKLAADHFSFLIDGRNKQFLDTDFTYEKAKELFSRIETCGYWEKDLKVVEEKPHENGEADESSVAKENVKSAAVAPAPTNVPTPTFEEKNAILPAVQSIVLPAPNAAVNMKTASSVEHAYFNQVKLVGNGIPIPASGAPFSFLQDSELDVPIMSQAAGSQQQHQMPITVMQSHHNHQQHQSTQNPSSSVNAPPQMFPPPGLNLPTNRNIPPTDYQTNSQGQRVAVRSPQVPSNVIPLQATTPLQNAARNSYPTMMPNSQYSKATPNLQNMKSVEGGVPSGNAVPKKSSNNDKQQREKYDQQPQIDTWTNDAVAPAGSNTNNNPSTRSSSGGYNQRNNRPPGGSGGGGNQKYNNYRTPRNFNENGNNGDGQFNNGTYFRNNERYNNGTATSGSTSRYENPRGAGAKRGEDNRGGNYRMGRFSASQGAASAAPSNSGQPQQRRQN